MSVQLVEIDDALYVVAGADKFKVEPDDLVWMKRVIADFDARTAKMRERAYGP